VPPDAQENVQADLAPSPAPAEAPRPRPFGFWATAGLSLACFILWALIGTIVVMAFVAAEKAMGRAADIEDYMRGLGSNGLVLAAATLAAAPPCFGILALFAWLRGWRVRDYLGLRLPPWQQAAWALAALAFLIVATDLVTHLVGRPIVPEFMTQAYRTAGWLPLLVAALLVGAPLFEETLLRGFLFRGIAESPLGGIAAVIITSVIFGLLHLQYDGYGMLVIFVGGLLLGAVRLATGSVALAMLLHSAMNLVATIETAIVVDVLR
jgi:hypothetical protein